ncbi:MULTISPECIES: CopG family transcriptional regulator [Streptococcus]|uniref:CopG family transcriptional regulator n=1 Tax=Streptococcus TaxID=1301 RepID=UPI001E320A4A|nr:CopG family transcriptional regulator [Streptococcus suis]MCL4935422.1 CopG family transcriptional regulator [Streptococcus suis]WNF72437.1 CopG family transcriptional regulator [Streptococcus suis]
MAQKVGDEMSPRTGRPKSEKPLNVEVKARIDTELNKQLEDYCLQKKTTRTEVVRKGIKLVLGLEENK